MKMQDYGFILLLLVIVSQIISSFLVVKISIQRSGNALPNQTYGTTLDSSMALNASLNLNTSEKTWHTVEVWVFSVYTVTVSSVNYLIFMKEEDRSDIDIIKEKDVERLNVKLRRWRRKMRKVLCQIRVWFCLMHLFLL